MSGHTLNVILDDENHIVLTAVCHESGDASCHRVCEEECETDYDCPAEHIKTVDYCCLVTWLNEEDDLRECYRGDYPQPLRDGMLISITWDGDHYEWSALENSPG